MPCEREASPGRGEKVLHESSLPGNAKAVIEVSGLSKRFAIYDSPRDRLRQLVFPGVRRLLGRPARSYYREFWALKGIDLQVREGETVGIIGKNGSGKSTLLQCICGTLSATGGKVRTRGRIAALLELGAGFNPQFTGRENIDLNAALLGLQQDEIDARLPAIIQFADIGDYIDQPVRTYSSGMFVRLAFAVAVHVDPAVIIVDESLAVGDIRFQSKCLRRIADLKSEGKSILLVSHSMSQIEAFCDRVIWLDEGQIRESGRPASVTRHYVDAMVHGVTQRGAEPLAPDSINDVLTGPESWWDVSPAHHVKSEPGYAITRFRVQIGQEHETREIGPIAFPLALEMEWLADHEVAFPLVALGIFNELNEPVIHFNSSNVRAQVRSLPAGMPARIRIRASIPALKPGQYLLALGMDEGFTGNSRLLCHVYDAWAFRVTQGEVHGGQAGYIQCRDASIECI